MTTLTITARGQATLRKEILAHLHARPGDKIVADILPDGRVELRGAHPEGKISDVFGLLVQGWVKAIDIVTSSGGRALAP